MIRHRPQHIVDVSNDPIPPPKSIEAVHKNQLLLPDGLASVGIFGGSGTGKSYLLLSVVPALTDRVKSLIIATTVKNNPTHDALMSWAAGHKMGRGIVDNPDSLMGELEKMREKGELSPQKQLCIVFDDFSSVKEKSKFLECIAQVVSKFRNEGCHYIVISQSSQQIPASVRNNLRTIITFTCGNYMAKRVFDFDVAIPQTRAHAQAYEDLRDFIEEIPYAYLCHVKSPFRLMAGYGNSLALVADRESVKIPDVAEVCADLVVSSERQARQKSAALQKEMGNDSGKLSLHKARE